MKVGFTYRRTIAILLLVIYIVNPFKILLPYLSYQIHYNYISTVLCQNKNKPETNCEGKCHLKKELKKAVEEESTGREIVLKVLETEEVTSPEILTKYRAVIYIENPFSPFDFPFYHSTIQDITTPPPRS